MSSIDPVSRNVPMAYLSCAKCGILFAVPQVWDRARRDTLDELCCPNGHFTRFTTAGPNSRSVDEIVAAKPSKIPDLPENVLLNRAGWMLCPFCERTYKSGVGMAEHLRRIHQRNEQQVQAAMAHIPPGLGSRGQRK